MNTLFFYILHPCVLKYVERYFQAVFHNIFVSPVSLIILLCMQKIKFSIRVKIKLNLVQKSLERVCEHVKIYYLCLQLYSRETKRIFFFNFKYLRVVLNFHFRIKKKNFFYIYTDQRLES